MARRKRAVRKTGRKRRPWIAQLRLCMRLFFLAALSLLVAWWYRAVLPDQKEILSTLEQDPIQKSTRSEPFEFEYMNKNYRVQPVADYEIWGVLVTHNNPQGMADIYHDASAVDLRDFCLIWGKNTEGNLHQRMEFWSNTWTCHVKANDRQDYQLFRGDQLSNNHLFAGSAKVRDTILNTHIGDQVHLKGMLINYQGIDQPGLKRESSTVRTDTGNGACEVLFVEEIEILKAGNPGWNKVYFGAKYTCGILGVLILILFCLSALGEQKQINLSIAQAEERKRRKYFK